jgi:hypothetical protein
MKRLKKAILLPLRKIAYGCNRLRLYYWAEEKLCDLKDVNVMPSFYYSWLYHVCMRLVKSRKFKRLANRMIHTIPYHVRFKVA